MTDFVYLQALVGNGTATFLPCERLELGDDLDETTGGGRFAFTLWNSTGDALDVRHLDVASSCHPLDQGVLVVSGLLRAQEGMATATITQDDVELASIDLDKLPPRVEVVSCPAEGEEVTGRRTIEWRSSTDDGAMVGHSLWYSSDGEGEWIPVTLGLAEGIVDVDFDALPGGERARVRVTATCGASVAAAMSAPFKVPTPPTFCELLAPPSGWTTAPGVAIPAHAVVRVWKDGVLTDAEQVHWHSDRDGDLGVGTRRNLILQRPGVHAVSVDAHGPDGPVSAETSITVVRPGVRFVHRAEPGNITGNSTVVSHPTLDGRPDAVMQVTAVGREDGATIKQGVGAVGVWYDGKRWSIFHEDMTDVLMDQLFNVEVNQPGPNLFVNVGGTSGNTSRVEHPSCDGARDAVLLATANWNPNGQDGVYNVAHIGVWYDEAVARWGVFNQGLQPMPVGAAFNIEVLRSGEGVWVHTATESNTVGDRTYVDDATVNDDPTAVLCVTPSWNPPAGSGVYDDAAAGVLFDSVKGRWSITHLDGTSIPLGSAFNVAVTT